MNDSDAVLHLSNEKTKKLIFFALLLNKSLAEPLYRNIIPAGVITENLDINSFNIDCDIPKKLNEIKGLCEKLTKKLDLSLEDDILIQKINSFIPNKVKTNHSFVSLPTVYKGQVEKINYENIKKIVFDPPIDKFPRLHKFFENIVIPACKNHPAYKSQIWVYEELLENSNKLLSKNFKDKYKNEYLELHQFTKTRKKKSKNKDLNTEKIPQLYRFMPKEIFFVKN